MKKWTYLLKSFTLLLALALVGCGPKKEENTLNDEGIDINAQFFGIVYVTKASRVIGSSSWRQVEGQQRLKFLAVTGDDGTGGNFTMQYTNYKEPQLYSDNPTAPGCSGGYEGSFSVQETSSTVVSSDPEGPYDPSNPYNGGGGNEDNSSDTSTPNSYYFLFNLNVGRVSFPQDGTCTRVNPLQSHQLRAIRFKNGDLQLTNQSRGLEFYLVPELI